MHWVEKSAGVFLPGDLALPGDSIRVIVDASAANVAAWHNDLYRVHPGPAARALHALGPAHDGRALYVGWPHPFTGSCWRCGDAG